MPEGIKRKMEEGALSFVLVSKKEYYVFSK